MATERQIINTALCGSPTTGPDREVVSRAFDHSGERVLKLTGKNTLIDVNAEMVNYYSLVGDVTLYTSPYLVANNSGYTKHYYAGSERICARLGNGNLNYHQTQAQPFIGNDPLLDINSKMFADAS